MFNISVKKFIRKNFKDKYHNKKIEFNDAIIVKRENIAISIEKNFKTKHFYDENFYQFKYCHDCTAFEIAKIKIFSIFIIINKNEYFFSRIAIICQLPCNFSQCIITFLFLILYIFCLCL